MGQYITLTKERETYLKSNPDAKLTEKEENAIHEYIDDLFGLSYTKNYLKMMKEKEKAENERV